MAYKARRTRDLQGEVQAGTNVSVQETTKPDGTKVYTLSADSGEIPTLADMSNSLAMWRVAEVNLQDDNNDYYCIIDESGIQEKQIEEIGEFYEFAKSNIVCCTIGVDTYYLSGVKFLKSGTYLITCNFQIYAGANCKPIFNIKKEDADGTEIYICDATYTLQADDETLITFTTYININENDIICPFMMCDNDFSLSNAIILSMQKIR